MTTKPKTRKAPAAKDIDPVFAAIAKHKALIKEMMRLSKKLDGAELAAMETHGPRPDGNLAWREQLDKKYPNLKAREIAAERAGVEWDERAGIAPLREESGRARRAEHKSAIRMARTKPTTLAGTAAMVAYTRRYIDIGESEIGWPNLALKTVAHALAEMSAEGV